MIVRFQLSIIALLFISISAYAQKSLSTSPQSSKQSYFYPIDDESLQKLYKGKPLDEATLKSPLDSCLTENCKLPKLPPGNYLKIFVQRKSLMYSIFERPSASIKLLPNKKDLQFLVIDQRGKEVTNAEVFHDNKRIAYDSEGKRYHTRFPRKTESLLKVRYAGVLNVVALTFEDNDKPQGITRIFRSRKKGSYAYEFQRYGSGGYGSGISTSSYLVFNKPKYKPNDTLKLKAFILKGKFRRPVKDKLTVKLTGDNLNKEFATVDAQSAGSYTFNLLLHDSLKLSLDKYYNVQLLHKNRVYASGSFQFEDYELKSVSFSMRGAKASHNRKEPQSLYIKAVDENGLNVMDGRVEVIVNASSSSNFFGDKVFIPDTLWKHSLKLDQVGETKLELPDSIFPAADLNYAVEARFLNSDNDQRRETAFFRFYDRQADKIHFELKGDSLFVKTRDTSRAASKIYKIKGVSLDDEIVEELSVNLPAAVVVKHNVAEYKVEGVNDTASFDLSELNAGLELTSLLTRDSLTIEATNPRNVPVWYTLLKGNKVVDRGVMKNNRYRSKSNEKKALTFIASYVWADRVGESTLKSTFAEKMLNLEISHPPVISPGEKANIKVKVTDASGIPVKDVDLTAYAITSKFNASAPVIPYLGKQYPNAGQKPDLDIDNGFIGRSLVLDYSRWSAQMGLDSIEYFRFTHPAPSYRYTEKGPEGLTQIAPFLIENGRILPVEMLHINDQLVFFSKAEQQKHYAFLVNTAEVNLRFRLRDRVVTANNISVTKGQRLVLSLNVDTTLNKDIQITSAATSLSDYEASMLNNHMIKVEDTYSPRFGVIRTKDQVLLLDPIQNTWDMRQTKLVGPLHHNYARFNVQEGYAIDFKGEPNSTYAFTKGFLHQRTSQQKPPFNTLLNNTNAASYTDKVLSNKAVDSLWEAYLDLRSHTTTIFDNALLPARGNGRLKIQMKKDPEGKIPFLKNIVVYSNADSSFRNIYPGNTQDLGYLIPGKYKLLFLLKGDRYVIKKNLAVRENGTNAITVDLSGPEPADTLSWKIASFIKKRSIALAEELVKANMPTAEFRQAYTNPGQYKASVTGIVYSKTDNLPLPGVLVRIKDTKYGVFSNVDGIFSINVPERGELEFLSIGFKLQEHEIKKSGQYLDIRLETEDTELNEVAVVGYATREKSSLEGTLAGKVAGVMVTGKLASAVVIRGNTTARSGDPLLIVDGQLFDGILQDIPTEEIADMTMLKDAAAIAVYGSRAKNGVILIRTKKANLSENQTTTTVDPNSSLRRNFSDYAFWQPSLRTDGEGRASFNVTFPDDITSWHTHFIGMNASAQSGYKAGSIKAFKSVNAAIVSPAFAITGDTFAPIGKVMNYTADPVAIRRSFTVNGQLLVSDSLLVKSAHIDTFKVVVKGLDSLSFKYRISKQSGTIDGEQRSIPVFNPGVKENVGRFEALNRDTTLTFSFNPKLGAVTFRAESSILPMLLDETEHLRRYEYLCNEQLASKLKALLVQKRIKSYLKQPFTHEREVKQIIRKLGDTKRPDGNWGWWVNSDAEIWISKHVIEAFLDAEAEGYQTSLDKRAVVAQMAKTFSNYSGVDRLEALLLLKRLDAKLDYKTEIGRYEAEKSLTNRKLNVYEMFKLYWFKQSAGVHVSPDDLAAYKHFSMMGNVYYGAPDTKLFDNSIQISLLAYKIVKASKQQPELLAKIRNYFLEQRRSGTWRNTYESALILETILPDLLSDPVIGAPATLKLDAAGTKSIKDFPYTATLDPSTNLKVQKSGGLPVYVTAYQQFWNENPKQAAEGFSVKTWFETNNGRNVERLKGGEAVVLKAEVHVKGDADYVMVEVPIPAGCSYDEKEQSWWGAETHREYAKNKVSIFCKRLKAGKYIFDVKLMPRYDGQYRLNPAKAEMMYFPVFYGREQMKQVVIGTLVN